MNSETAVKLVDVFSRKYWGGALPERENDAGAVAAILFLFEPPESIHDDVAFLLAQALDILRRQRSAWTN